MATRLPLEDNAIEVLPNRSPSAWPDHILTHLDPTSIVGGKLIYLHLAYYRFTSSVIPMVDTTNSDKTPIRWQGNRPTKTIIDCLTDHVLSYLDPTSLTAVKDPHRTFILLGTPNRHPTTVGGEGTSPAKIIITPFPCQILMYVDPTTLRPIRWLMTRMVKL